MKNNLGPIILIIGIIIILGIWLIKKHNSGESSTGNIFVSSSSVRQDSVPGEKNRPEDAYELLGIDHAEEIMDLRLGMGPGLFGSGRHTVEMVVL